MSNRSSLKIGILLRNRHDGPGGLEKVLEIVAREMPKYDVELYFYGLYPLGYTDFTKDFSHLTILPLPKSLAFLESKLPKSIGRLVRKSYIKYCGYRLFEQIEKDQIDLLITMDLSKQFLGNYRFLKQLKEQGNIPILSWVHSSLSANSVDVAHRVRNKINLFDGHLAISSGIAEEIAQNYQGRNISVIYNPVKKASLVKRDKSKFIYIGRIDENKRVASLLEQLLVLQGKWHLDIYGSTGNKDGDQCFQKMITKLGLEQNAVFHGWKPDVWAEIDTAGILILNSKKEAFGLVILEAMQRGIPVLAADSLGPKSLINQNNGWLYPVDEENKILGYLQNILDGDLELPPRSVVKQSVACFEVNTYMENLIKIIKTNYIHME